MYRYYFLRQDLFQTNGIIEIHGHSEDTAKYIWTKGHRIADSIPVQELLLNPEYGENLSDFFDTGVPVMSDRLILKLKELGVDNFDCYPVVLKRMDTGEAFSGYKIVNFIGKLDAIDYEKSEMKPKKLRHYGPIFIDESKVDGLKAFRLKRGTTLLVVNERVAKILMEQEYKAVLLQPTSEYSGT